MAWVKIDDHFDEHPKLAEVGPVGWGVWLAGLAYANRNLTDGFIPFSVAESIGGRWRVYIRDGQGCRVWRITRSSGHVGEDVDAEWVATLLVEAGLWEEADGGYQIHDYLDYQPSKEEVVRVRALRSEAGARGGKAKGGKAGGRVKQSAKQSAGNLLSKTQAKSYPVPVPVPVPEPGTMGTSSGTPNGVPTEAAAASAPPVSPDASEPAPDSPPDAPGGPDAEARPYWEQFRREDHLVRDFCQILNLRAPQQVKDARAFARVGGLVKLVGPGLVAEALLSLDVRHSREPFANPVDAFAYLKATAQKQRDSIAEREARAAAPPPRPPQEQPMSLADICDENTRIAEEEGLPAWRWEEARRRRRERETAAKSAT